jgi:C4-dicarboxylate transporter, DcuC family
MAFALAIAFIVSIAAGYFMVRGRHPQLILAGAGLVMLACSLLLGGSGTADQSTGLAFFDLFRSVTESLKSKLSGIGAMIMVIAGFVSYMDYMGATAALVRIGTKPISVLKRWPYLAAVAVIPLGQLLSLCVPSAAGLGLLMIATVHPILIRIGVSKITSVSIIVLCTCFDMGPASANTARAAELLQMDNVQYFVASQLPLATMLTFALMVFVYFQSKYLDSRMSSDQPLAQQTATADDAASPLAYAILPVLPLILLMTFNAFFQTGEHPIVLDTTTAMLISLFVSMAFHGLVARNVRELESGIIACWNGMGRAFSTIITLIVVADIFASGLIALGLIDGLLVLSNAMGWGAIGILTLFIALIFFASILMGSGNASFFAFGPLIPDLARTLGIPGIKFLLPMQLASSMGRAASPIAGVVIATAGIAGVNPMHVARRNLLPMMLLSVLMVLIQQFAT